MFSGSIDKQHRAVNRQKLLVALNISRFYGMDFMDLKSQIKHNIALR